MSKTLYSLLKGFNSKKFVSTLYDFHHKAEGVVAILTNGNLKETIFVVGHPQPDRKFDVDTFKKSVASITFDKEIFEPTAAGQIKAKISHS